MRKNNHITTFDDLKNKIESTTKAIKGDTSPTTNNDINKPLPQIVKKARNMVVMTKTHYSVSEDETGKQIVTQTTFKEAEQGFIFIKGECRKLIWNAKDVPYLLELQLRG
jgi:hypothetical protein